MIRVLLLSVILILSANRAEVLGGSVGVFSDAGGLECNIYDTSPGLFSVYIVHFLSAGVSSISFTAPIPGCASGVTWDSDEPMFGTAIGDSQTGVTVLYGSGCVFTSSITVMKINLIGNGFTPDCCEFEVEPFPGAGAIEVVDCNGNITDADPRTATINGDYFLCNCQLWVPVRSQSWGAIKALYEQQ